MEKYSYVRLLSYDKAMSLINFVNQNDIGYANIVVGGVQLDVEADKMEVVNNFLINSGEAFELSSIHPINTNKRITEWLKNG